MLQVRYTTTAGKGWKHPNGNLGIPASVFLDGNATSTDSFPDTFDSAYVWIDGSQQYPKEAWVENNTVIITNGTSLTPDIPIVVIFSIAD